MVDYYTLVNVIIYGPDYHNTTLNEVMAVHAIWAVMAVHAIWAVMAVHAIWAVMAVHAIRAVQSGVSIPH